MPSSASNAMASDTQATLASHELQLQQVPQLVQEQVQQLLRQAHQPPQLGKAEFKEDETLESWLLTIGTLPRSSA